MRHYWMVDVMDYSSLGGPMGSPSSTPTIKQILCRTQAIAVREAAADYHTRTQQPLPTPTRASRSEIAYDGGSVGYRLSTMTLVAK